MRTICCIATGPSVTAEQVAVARRKGFELYVCNDAFRLAPDAALLHACNIGWWRLRWDEVKDLPAQKWTTNKDAAREFGINWIQEKPGYGDGLSEDPRWLHHGHGSGFQLLGMAYRARPDRIALLGYDLKYAPDYDGRTREIGSTPRHFFGEYPPELQHWPSRQVHGGVHVELLGFYQCVSEHSRRCEIVQCSPDTALTCFPMKDIRDVV